MAVLAAGKVRERERRFRRIAGLVAACSAAFVVGLKKLPMRYRLKPAA